jgi:hypothetical protein
MRRAKDCPWSSGRVLFTSGILHTFFHVSRFLIFLGPGSHFRSDYIWRLVVSRSFAGSG